MKAWITRGGPLWALALCLVFLAPSARADAVDADSSAAWLEISVPAASVAPGAVPGVEPVTASEPATATDAVEATAAVEPVEAAAAVEPAETPAAEAGSELEYDPLFDEDFEDFDGPEVNDPLESGNRAVFGFNQQVDRFVWKPLTAGYRFIVPARARHSVRLFVRNLNTPVYFMNHLLQLRPGAAVETLSAFVVNSTFGLGGLLDAGAWVGLEPQAADFGQTLALIGVGSGPYLVVPLIGPSTVRDGFGWVVDRAFHPLTYLVGIYPQLMIEGGVGMARREEVGPKLEALEESALDYYAVVRSAYAQSREKSIDDRRIERDGDDTAEVADAAAPDASPLDAAVLDAAPLDVTPVAAGY